jgi:hypothetical protein
LEKQFAQLESSGAGADAMLEDLKRKMLTEDAGSTGPGTGQSPAP